MLQLDLKAFSYSGTRCPVCGDAFGRQLSRDNHCRIAHGVRLNSVESTCETCGCTFERSRKHLDRSDSNYCSEECHHEGRRSGEYVDCTTCGESIWRPRHRLEQNSEHYCSYECRKAQEEVVCDTCGAEGTRRQSQIRSQDAVYCSIDCRAEAQQDRVQCVCDECGTEFEKTSHFSQRSLKDFCSRACYHASRGEIIELECERCEATFEREESLVGRHQSEYCSQDCYHRSRSGGLGVTTEAIRHSLSPKSWQEIAARTRRRSGGACEMCGAPREALERELDVHHIVPIRCGGTHHPDNLMALCPPCHQTTELYTRNSIDLPVVLAD